MGEPKKFVACEPRKVRFTCVEHDYAVCSCCYGSAPIAVRVEAWEGGTEQRDAVTGGPEMRGDVVEKADGRGFVLLCMACVSSMTNAIRRVEPAEEPTL